MKVRTEILVAVGSLLTVQIVTSFGATALLTQVSPGVERILRDNVDSIDAVQRMQGALLALRTSPMAAEDARKQFRAAYDRARANVTEPAETVPLDAIARHADAALAGDALAQTATVAALEQLSAVNHSAMVGKEAEVRRLGLAGAWAAVLLAAVGFLMSGLVVHRLSRRLLGPLQELHTAVAAWHHGDAHRRCKTGDLPAEFRDVAVTFNELLDRHPVELQGHVPAQAVEDRAALLGLLDRVAEPCAVVDAHGRILATNHAGLEWLEAERGAVLRAAAEALADGAQAPESVGAEKLRPGLWLCRLTAPPEPAAPPAPSA